MIELIGLVWLGCWWLFIGSAAAFYEESPKEWDGPTWAFVGVCLLVAPIAVIAGVCVNWGKRPDFSWAKPGTAWWNVWLVALNILVVTDGATRGHFYWINGIAAMLCAGMAAYIFRTHKTTRLVVSNIPPPMPVLGGLGRIQNPSGVQNVTFTGAGGAGSGGGGLGGNGGSFAPVMPVSHTLPLRGFGGTILMLKMGDFWRLASAVFGTAPTTYYIVIQDGIEHKYASPMSAALMLIVHQISDWPDANYSVEMGFRYWIYDPNKGVLCSPTQGTPWFDCELRCDKWDKSDVVRGVAGIHAHYVNVDWRKKGEKFYHMGQGITYVCGIVERFGHFVRGTDGWRGEVAIIRELHAPNAALAAALKHTYPEAKITWKGQDDGHR